MVSQQGRYLLSTDFHGSNVKLYGLDTFFVEVYYHPVLKTIMRISAASDDDMGKHLAKINLSF